MATKKIEFLSKSIGNFEDWAADASKSFISKNPTAGDAVNTVITGLKPFFYEAAHDSEFQALAMRTAHRNFMQAFYLFVDEYVCVEYKNALKVNVDYDLALKAMNFPKLFSMLKDLHTALASLKTECLCWLMQWWNLPPLKCSIQNQSRSIVQGITS